MCKDQLEQREREVKVTKSELEESGSIIVDRLVITNELQKSNERLSAELKQVLHEKEVCQKLMNMKIFVATFLLTGSEKAVFHTPASHHASYFFRKLCPNSSLFEHLNRKPDKLWSC